MMTSTLTTLQPTKADHYNACRALGADELTADLYATLRVCGYPAHEARAIVIEGANRRHALGWEGLE